MRDALNSNPMVQAAVIGVLLLGTAFFFVSTMGGEEEESAGTETTAPAAEAAPGTATAPATVNLEAGAAPTAPAAVPTIPPSAAVEAPPLPPAVSKAYESGQTVVLLFVREGGIDDRRVEVATAGVEGLRDVALFVVPARHIARYMSITGGVGVDRVPALVVVSPKDRDRTLPTASVSYGFQSPQSVVQAVVDAGYEGPTVDYHP